MIGTAERTGKVVIHVQGRMQMISYITAWKSKRHG